MRIELQVEAVGVPQPLGHRAVVPVHLLRIAPRLPIDLALQHACIAPAELRLQQGYIYIYIYIAEACSM